MYMSYIHLCGCAARARARCPGEGEQARGQARCVSNLVHNPTLITSYGFITYARCRLAASRPIFVAPPRAQGR
eukprot:2494528-Prymnesium_polylepis.2